MPTNLKPNERAIVYNCRKTAWFCKEGDKHPNCSEGEEILVYHEGEPVPGKPGQKVRIVMEGDKMPPIGENEICVMIRDGVPIE